MDEVERIRYLLELDKHLKKIDKLKALLREANEALVSHPVGLCNRIHQATTSESESNNES